MTENPLSNLHRQVWTALLAAMIAVGAMIQLPLGPVPLTLQTFFVVLAGLALGPLYGAAAMILYLLTGAIGLPVFSGGKAGFAHLLGPTGGYLLGFIATALLAGFGGGNRPRHILVTTVCSLFGLAAVYAIGMVRLKMLLELTWTKTFTIGLVPFLLSDLIKTIAAVSAYRFLFAKRLLP